MTKAREAAKAAVAAYVDVDYPQEGERIASPDYALRIAAADAERLEVSIDKAGWQSCRSSAGYWWYDWSGYQNGKHEAVARATTRGGRTVKSKPRRFEVTLQS